MYCSLCTIEHYVDVEHQMDMVFASEEFPGEMTAAHNFVDTCSQTLTNTSSKMGHLRVDANKPTEGYILRNLVSACEHSYLM